jgi:SnoaL-like domain
MTRGGSVEIIENFWAQVWQSRNSHAVDKLIAEDFTITSGGVDIHSHAEFKKWISAFLSSINDFRFEVIETFQNEDGSRIASRWRVAGKNNGFMGSEPCQTPFTMVSTAVWEVREDAPVAAQLGRTQRLRS